MTDLGEIKLRKFDKDKHILNVQIKITTEFRFRLWLAKNLFCLGAKILGAQLKITSMIPKGDVK